MNLNDFLTHSDAVTLFLAALLLALSVASWVVILYKLVLVRTAQRSIQLAKSAFWQAPDEVQARQRLQALDSAQWLTPLLDARQQLLPGSLGAVAQSPAQLTRVLREALRVLRLRLQWGQVVLATVGATSPFVGLLGTVWGIFHALVGIGQSSQFTLERVATPVGEALIMTAAGLVVAIPAVMAYNLLGRRIAQLEAELEGFAQDLLGLWQDTSRTGR